MGKKKQLTPRQAALTKNLLNGATITEAARRAGYSEKNLAQSGHQALKAIRLRMPEPMDEAGLTERALIEKHLVPLLNAKTSKFFQHRGKVTDQRTVPDNDTRLRALETAFELRGSYSSAPQPDAAQIGVKVVIVDVPRPNRYIPHILPAPLPPGKYGHQPSLPEEPKKLPSVGGTYLKNGGCENIEEASQYPFKKP